MRPIGFKRQSQTGWENSHFGGAQRLIWDYPYVNVPDDFDFTPKAGGTDLQHYSAGKLQKIFFMAAKEHGLADKIFDPSTAEIIEKKKGWFSTETEKKLRLRSTTESINNILPTLMDREPELAPLFQEYQQFLAGSEYEFYTDPPGGGKGEGQGGEGDDQKQDGDGMQGQGQGSGSEGEGDQEGNGQGSGGQGEGEGQDQGQGAGGQGQGEGEEQEGKGQGGAGNGDGKEEGQKAMAAHKKVIGGRLDEAINKCRKGVTQSYSYEAGSITTGTDVVPSFKRIQPNGKTQFFDHEKQNAEMLSKLLDITWDTDKDIVKSLRMGKIDITKIAEVPAGNVAIYQREMEEMSTKPFSVCILVDESGSMGRCRPNQANTWQYDEDTDKEYKSYNRATAAYHLVKSLYLSFSQILPQDKLYIYGHTTGGPTGAQVFTYHDPYNQNFEETIEDMVDRSRGSNYDGPVVKAIHEKVREFTEDRIIFIVLSDGSPAASGYGGKEDIKDFKRIVERAKRDEFVTAGVFIQYAGIKDMYNYHTKITNLDQMPKKVSHLLNKIVKTEFQ